MSEAPLSGVRVLDLSERIAGPYCTKLFADLGADVIKLEPPGRGDAARQLAPFVTPEPDPEGSALFLHLNTNKRSAALDPAADREHLVALVREADVLVESAGPGALERLRLGYRDLERLNPGLVVTSITNFGQNGPYRDWLVTDLVLNALNGMMYVTGESGTPPVKLGLHQAQYTAGAAAAVATLAAHRFSRLTGQGQQIDVSLLEPMLNSVHQQTARYAYWGVIPGRPWWREPASVLQAADGWLFAPLAFFRRPGVIQAMGMPEVLGSEHYQNLDRLDAEPRRARVAEMREIATEWLRGQKGLEVCSRAQRAGLAWAPVNDEAQILACPQLAARGALEEVEHLEAGTLRLPRRYFVSDKIRPVAVVPAPRLGEHTDEVLADGWRPRKPREPPSSDIRAPLEGIRILTPEHWAALPHATKYLAALGAEVLSIERLDRPHRAGDPLYNEGWRSKRIASLDLGKAEGVDLFRRLAASADIVADNFTPRVMKSFGLDEASLRAVKGDLIVLSISGFGHAGEREVWRGHTVTAEASCGLMNMTGFPDGPPLRPGGTPHGDMVTGLHAAWSMLVALEHRERTGEGARIDMSMTEPNLMQLGEAVVHYSATGRPLGRIGNRDLNAAPSGCYRCRGDDAWVAISVESDEQWRALAGLLDSAAASDASLATAAGRRQREAELDALLTRWTESRTPREAMTACQQAGVPAGAVLNIPELLTDEHVVARGAFEVVPVEGLGPRVHLGPPWKLSRTPASNQHSPAARLGQDNAYVYGTLLGLDEAELADLEEQGVIQSSDEIDTRDFSPRVRPEHFDRRDEDFLRILGL